MIDLLAVGLGGFLGAITRHKISLWFVHNFSNSFPFATLLVNCIGCFIIGFMLYFTSNSISLSVQMKRFIITGFLGSLTTFSAFGYATYDLFKNNEPYLAGLNIAGNIIIGLISVGAGHFIAKSFSS